MYTYDVPEQPHGRFVLLAASSLSLHFFQRAGIGRESKTGVDLAEGWKGFMQHYLNEIWPEDIFQESREEKGLEKENPTETSPPFPRECVGAAGSWDGKEKEDASWRGSLWR